MDNGVTDYDEREATQLMIMALVLLFLVAAPVLLPTLGHIGSLVAARWGVGVS